MKDVSRIMYTIGKIFSVIEIALSTLFVAGGILFRVNAEEIYKHQGRTGTLTAGDFRQIGLIIIITGALFLLICTVVFIIATIAQRKLKNDKKDLVPHIIMIVIGVFGDIFYLLGGVFGIVAEQETEEN